MARARASATSSTPLILVCKIISTVLIISALTEEPEPVKKFLTSLGVYSIMGISKRLKVERMAPRASATIIPVF